MKGLVILWMGILGVLSLPAQTFSIKERVSGKVCTNDTLKLQLIDNGFQGWQSLNIELLITNSSNISHNTGARKMEFDTIRDASHSFCFAGNCFDEKTWVSPLTDTIKPGGTDSTFSGHLIFDNRVHTPKINRVGYVFYDINNPSDSAVVYVIYDSHPVAGIKGNPDSDRMKAFPNPADEVLQIANTDIIPLNIEVYNALGERMVCATESVDGGLQVSTAALPNGTYHLVCRGVSQKIIHGTFTVIH